MIYALTSFALVEMHLPAMFSIQLLDIIYDVRQSLERASGAHQ